MAGADVYDRRDSPRRRPAYSDEIIGIGMMIVPEFAGRGSI
jgi:hypothetical protein